MTKKNIALITIFLLVTSIWATIQFPKPQGWVNDFSEVFDPATKANLSNILTELNQKTGVEIAVVAVKDFQGLDRDTYATDLFESWGIGSRNDEGILILLATEEREIKIEVGYGSEGYLTDGTAGQLLDEYVIPHLAANDFNQGLFYAGLVFSSYVAEAKGIELTGMPSNIPVSSHQQSNEQFYFELILLAIFIFLVIITRGRILVWMMLLLGRGGRGGGRGGMSGGFGGFGGGRSGGGGAGRRF
ncbi:MAG: TPM domain-containing protein [Candidatus Cloacimonetes bacterium]|nr:TPM domain-containing protein [Candidatus Cloacimonadota bacterium]